MLIFVEFLFAVDVDYSVPRSLTFRINPSTALVLCVPLMTIEDTLSEGTEQFELYFVNLPSSSAGVTDPETSCITIVDDDGMYSLTFV